ncbi:rod shape-determining protein RodA [Beggiatoa leptomitoformis]|uniref:Peptidoglycan glycosyltransferase MrdB n=1 Tax=Beggiatoa leptomitoformis TaxID=288004 RepID=A0A2N9YFH7_9GAMM|nr:rod shape-determining protein RodA [Beggiatoa leptomitoformis]ALG68434.1 rod shape-determining protein RodA [Beggiatoa leptomitoformis]AUI69234.1 rod shape-determining protein RodA [Beggiatoa leptomitoformis]
MQTNLNTTHFMHLDKQMLFGLIILASIGLVVVYSADGQDLDLVFKQALRIFLGFIVMFAIAQIHPQQLMRWVPWIYLVGVTMLVAVFIVGDISKGAQRWLDFGIVRFQPSELMKLAVPLMIVWFIADRPLPPTYFRLSIATLLIAIPMLLIAKQPDLGTALLVGAAGTFVLLLGGIPWRLIFGLLALAPVAGYALWNVMHDYQRQRVFTLLNPEADPLGTGYHIIQSQIAIGSGGIYGKGWLNGTQSHLEFLPERSTDFIFAVYSEEFGLLGILLLLSIYIFILTRGMIIASQAQGSFSRLLAGSLILTFFVYIFVNMGMVTGIFPVVGVPLPMISYGGTSVVTLMAGFGLVMGVHTHKRLLSS